MPLKRKYWTDEETNYLREAYTSGVRVEEIGKRLTRFDFSNIYRRIRYLKLKLRGRGSNQPGKIVWTKDEIKYIKDHFHSSTNVQLAKALNKKLTVLRAKCRELGLLHMQLEYWTEEQVQCLRELYQTIGDSQLAALFQERWPKNKGWTNKHIEKKRKYLKLKRTTGEEFLIRTGRFNASDYKDFDGKQFPEGKKRLWFRNGKYRWVIKIGKSFTPYHRYKWEKLHGPIPSDKKLLFKDGDTTNCRMSNLVLLSRSDLAKVVSRKIHAQVSDSYVAGILSRDQELKKHLLQHPELLAAKRKQILLNREMGISKCKSKKIKSI